MSMNISTKELADRVRAIGKATDWTLLLEASDRLILLAAEVGRLNAELSKTAPKIDTYTVRFDHEAGAFGLVHDMGEAA